MESVLKYYRRYGIDETWEEITYEQALRSLISTYKDNDMTRDMLTIPNRIVYRFGEIEVKEHCDDGKVFVLAPGLSHALPIGVKYKKDGNHRKQRNAK